MTVTREMIIRQLMDEFELEAGEAEGDGLLSGGLLDSFSMLDLVNYIEKTAGIRFHPVDFNLQNLDSVDRLLRFLDERAAGG